MSADDVFTGWHATDDESPVPVRSSAVSAPKAEAPAAGPAQDIAASGRGHVMIRTHEQPTSSHGMTVSAVLGVLLALGGVALYFGTGNVNIRGDLTGAAPVTITITQDGHFNPTTVNVHPGDSITIENKNADPQVLKPKNSRDLFPVQVVFDQPYKFTVAADANGQYVYYSETLPDDRTVTFNVTNASVQSSVVSSVVSSVASSAASATVSIPLPFGGGSVNVPAGQPITPPVAVSSAASVDVQSTPHSGDTATIDIGGSSSSAASTAVADSSIPTNPYTVASAPKQTQNATASSAAANLHGGAPLLVQNIRSPRRTPDSGPAGFTLLFIPALLGVAALSRKLPVA